MVPGWVKGIGCGISYRSLCSHSWPKEALGIVRGGLKKTQISDTYLAAITLDLVDVNSDDVGAVKNEVHLYGRPLLSQLLQGFAMKPVNFVQSFGDSFVPGVVTQRRNNKVLAIGDDLQRRVHFNVQDFQQSFINDKRGAAAMTRQSLDHRSPLRSLWDYVSTLQHQNSS